ncbi:hypothetical protein M3D63_01170 [Kocuria palustris]|uniref:hypothetical protein n=1 Tax=Kocuria palustris TaxID=71999 RepID=UPI0021A6522C|nr:hypothetical protein [Kocuria palustris]MCT1833398.1 hypothetical protein [Kocuria palustris]
MPHLIIETTADIAAAPGYEAQKLIRAGLGALQEIGEYDMTAAKARGARARGLRRGSPA